jgi:hypothetical protein
VTRVTPHQIKPCFNILHVFTELNDNVIYYITSTLTYIITTVSKVETDITASFSTRPNERDVVIIFIGKLDIFPLISTSDIVCINEPTLILKHICQFDVTL